MRPTPTLKRFALMLLAGWVLVTDARAQDPARAELLYNTHCIGCHTTQVHWRDRKLVTDWASLLEQVRRWQAIQRLDWGEDDIVRVARHLNRRHYQLPETDAPVGPSASARGR